MSLGWLTTIVMGVAAVALILDDHPSADGSSTVSPARLKLASPDRRGRRSLCARTSAALEGLHPHGPAVGQDPDSKRAQSRLSSISAERPGAPVEETSHESQRNVQQQQVAAGPRSLHLLRDRRARDCGLFSTDKIGWTDLACLVGSWSFIGLTDRRAKPG